MKMFNINAALTVLLIFVVSTVAMAQDKQSDDQKEEKVIIIKETKDKDGKIRVETITKENGEIEVEVTVDGEVVDVEDVEDIEIIELKDGNSFFEDNSFETVYDLKLKLNEDFNFNFKDDDRGQLGVMLETKEGVKNEEKGTVVISEVFENSAAEAAGLKAGDIITAVDGKAVTTISEAVEAIKAHKAEEDVKIDYTRDGKAASVTATLKKAKQRNTFMWKGDDGQSFQWQGKNDLFEDRDIHVLKTHQNKGYLGINITDNENTKGAVITDINKESAAEAAGLKKGDVITGINGQKVESVNDLLNAMDGKKVDDEITIDYTRDGNTAQVKATLQKAANRRFGFFRSDDGDDYEIEIEMDNEGDKNHHWIEKKIEKHLGKVSMSQKGFLGVYLGGDDENGVKINGVVEEGAAERAGLQKGDIITKINDTAIEEYDDLSKALKDTKPEEVIKVTYTRDGQSKTVDVTLGKMKMPKMDAIIKGSGLDKCDDGSKRIVIIKKKGEEEVEVETEIEEEIEIDNPNQLEFQSMDLYPNPNNGTFTLNFQTDSKEAITVQVLSIQGKEVFREEIKDFSGSYTKKIDITNQAKGVYFLNILQGEQKMTKKLIYN